MLPLARTRPGVVAQWTLYRPAIDIRRGFRFSIFRLIYDFRFFVDFVMCKFDKYLMFMFAMFVIYIPIKC